MKNYSTFNLGRCGRVLVVLASAAAVWILLLGMESGLLVAQASELPPPKVDNTGWATLAYTTYLPIILGPPPDLVFFDNFSTDVNHWLSDSTSICSFGYYNNHYRVKVTKYNQRCIIPVPAAAMQVNGTFSMTVRRTSDSDWGVFYGFFFGAGSDAERDRWALEVRPDAVSECSSNKPFFWLSYLEDGSGELVNVTCTNTIETDNDWNRLKVIRNGANVKVYINGELKADKNKSVLLDKGYFDLEVISLYSGTSSSNPVVVEFDDFEVRRRTTP